MKIKKFDWILALILLLGGCARFWGIGFGLPHQNTHPDEWFIVYPTMSFFSGDLNPHNFSYPSFFRYILFAVYCFYFLIGKILGRYSSISDLTQELVSDPTNFYLMSRGLSAIFGIATIIIVYQISKILFNRNVALVASFFVSLAFLHVRDSHFGMTDSTMIFLLLTSLLFMIRAYYWQSIKNYTLSGFFGGLAMSTKYNALLLVIPMTLVHLFNTLNEKSTETQKSEYQIPPKLVKGIFWGLIIFGGFLIVLGIFGEQFFSFAFPSSELASLQPGALDRASKVLSAARSMATKFGTICIVFSILFFRVKVLSKFLSDFLDQRFFIFLAVFIGSFFLGTPFATVEFLAVAYGFLVEAVVNMSGKGVSLGNGWWYYGTFVLPYSLGWALFISAVIGALLLAKQYPRKAAILLSFPLVYYALVGKGVLVMVRYMTPLVPFACISAAFAVVFFAEKISAYLEARLSPKTIFSKKFISLFLSTLIIFQSASTIVKFDALLSREDNRLIAEEWVRESVPAGSSIFQTGAIYGHINLYPFYYLEQQKKEATAKGRDSWAELFELRINYLNKTNINKYEEWQYDRNENSFYYMDKAKDTLPDYIIQPDYPLLVIDNEVPEKLQSLLNSSYNLKMSFEVFEAESSENLFDKADALYFPFAGFKGVQRPGPSIYIYEKK